MWKNNTTFFTSLIFGLCEHQSLWRLFTRQVGARIFWKFSPRKLRSGWCLHFNSTLSTLFLNSSAVRSAVGAPMCEMKWSSQKFHCPVWSKIPDISTETGHSMFPIVFIWTLDDHRTPEITKNYNTSTETNLGSVVEGWTLSSFAQATKPVDLACFHTVWIHFEPSSSCG